MTCESGFWNGCGFEWLASYFGIHGAAILVLVCAALYVYDYIDRRKPRFGNLDTEVAEQIKREKPVITTDLNSLEGKQK
jgi:hypothetical protein